MSDRENKWHTTMDEKKHIDGLGTGKFSTSVWTSRLHLLQQYLKTMPMKTDWGTINQYEIKVYVQEAIKAEQRVREDPAFNVLSA